MRSLILLFSFMILLSCKGNTVETNETGTIKQDTTYTDLKGNKYKNIGQIPQNLRTPEQVRLIDKLNEIIINNMSVKDNHMVFNLSKEEFVAAGLPVRFYEILQKNIRDNNEFFDANGIKDVDKIVEKRKRVYKLSEKNRQ